jgi:hypothetical protein
MIHQIVTLVDWSSQAKPTEAYSYAAAIVIARNVCAAVTIVHAPVPGPFGTEPADHGWER